MTNFLFYKSIIDKIKNIFFKKKTLYGAIFLIFIFCTIPYYYSCTKDPSIHTIPPQIDSVVSTTESLDTLDKYINHFSSKKNKVGLAATYDKMGTIYKKNNRFAKAVIVHLKELELLHQLKDTLEIVHTYNEVCDNFKKMGDYDQASFYYYKAFAFSKVYSKRDDKPMMEHRVVSLNGIGEIFVKQENWQMADSAFSTALDCANRLGNTLQKAICYSNLGYVFESKGEIDSAWSYYRKSMLYSVEGHSDMGMALCHLYFGNLYQKKGNFEMALREYFWANELFSDIHDESNLIKSCIAIAGVYLEQGDKENMFQYLEKAKERTLKIHSVQYLSDIYHHYYQWYLRSGDSKQALDNYILSRTYADSVMNLVKMSQMYNTRLNFMQGNHQDELNSLTTNYTNEKYQRRMLLVSFVVASIIVSLIILFLSSLLYAKRKMVMVTKNMERIRSDFFTNVTHEFRTPLAVILGLSEQLKNNAKNTSEDLQKIGSVITFQGNQLLNLVNQLLDVSKIQSSLGSPRWCRGNVITYIDMLVENFQEVARQKHLELVFLSKEKSIEMDFISDYMNKIIRNLLSNAFKYTPEYGKIYITASIDKENLLVYVADTGQGISPEDKPHIFDPFYQGSNTSLSVGTGIGLSLVHQLVIAMQGTIKVKSSLNQGTVFIMRFPLKRKYADGEEYDVYSAKVNKNRQNVLVNSDELPQGKQDDKVTPLVLIVEDNSDVAFYIGQQLKKDYTLKYARNGKIALDLAEELIPDIIITDIVMPVMDGYELCRTVRESSQLNHIPIIIISVLNSEDERIKGLEAGADAYLCKPFNSKELNDRMEYLLNQRKLLRDKFSNEHEEEDNTASLSESDKQFLAKLTDITYSIMASGNVTVEEIASKMLMSRQQINKKIHAITGETTVNYLMLIRLNRAKKLLDSPNDYLIGDIAMQCGFEDIAYFSRSFKKVYNITPSQYRKRVKD